MKQLFTLLLIASVGYCSAQKMEVFVKPESAELYVQSVKSGNNKKLNLKTASMGVLAVAPDHVTEGRTFSELAKLGTETFTFELKKTSPLPAGYTSKKLELAQITDATGFVEKPARNGLYGIHLAATELNSAQFTTGLATTAADFGYTIDGSGGMFADKDAGATSDFAIGGNLIQWSKETAGDGYQVSLIVEWSVYSFAEKKVVMKMEGAGFSNAGLTNYNQSLVITMQDAMKALLNSAEFQELVKS